MAIAILVYGRTHSPFLTALAYALTYLPPIAGGPLLSGLADLFPRRRVMIVCDLFRVGTVGLMAIPGLPFAALCVLLFCTVLTGVPFSSARAALMPDVLPGDTFVLGSAIGNITYQASQILGFVAGAAVVAVLDPHKTLGIDAVTFGLSALILLTGVRSRPAPGRAGAARASLWSVSADGVRIVFGTAALLLALRPRHQGPRVRRCQSGLSPCMGRHPGRRRGGAADRRPLAVGLAGLVGLTAATMLAMSWTHLRGRLIQAHRTGRRALAPAARSAAC